MAPGKFGLFKSRSRDYQEQPSTENLLQSSASSETVTSGPPIPSTSNTTPEELAEMELAALRINSKAEVMAENEDATQRFSICSNGDTQIKYKKLQRQRSTDATSTTTLQAVDETLHSEEQELHNLSSFDFDDADGASTSCDANSIQFDETSSMAPSEDVSIHCGAMKKPKKTRSKEEQHMRDLDMWKATDFEVMQNLLSRRSTFDDQLKWEVIATARGLCTLTDTCGCDDCLRAKFLNEMTDGDGGLGAAAPVLNTIHIGCSVM